MKIKEIILSCWNFFWDVLLRRDVPDNSRWEIEVSCGSVPIIEVALHAADDWYENAQFRSDVRADLKSYYEGYRDALMFEKSKSGTK